MRLAIDGGTPARSGPVPPWPHFEEDEIEAVAEVMRSGRVNQWTGTTVDEFAEALADLFQMPYAVPVANGTVALELALHSFGVGPDDEVIVTPRSFIASASCALMVGATPVFADIDPVTHNMTADTIRKVLTSRTRAIIPVHLAGLPCDMEPIMGLARQHGLLVIEDCAQAHGAWRDGRPAGSFGDASAWSFCQDKIISTGGEGGCVLFADEAAFRQAESYKDHGKIHETARRPANGSFRWLHKGPGTNWRLTAMQAAIGLRQLKKLPNWVERRNENARRLSSVLNQYASVTCPRQSRRHSHAHYRLTALVEPERLRPDWSRDRLISALQAEGLPASAGGCPAIYREEIFRKRLERVPECPNAEDVGRRSISFLVHPTLNDIFLREAEDCLRKVFDAATA